MGTKTFNNYEDLLTFTRASKGHALRPVSYGDELVTNGTFDSDTSDWTITSSAVLAVDNNRLKITSTNAMGAYQDITTQAGKLYRFEWDYTEGTLAASSVTVRAYPSGDFSGESNDTAASEGYINFVATGNEARIYFRNDGTGTSFFDNASVKEVTFDESDGTLTLFEHPNNVPRVEYDADRNRLGLLVEESRTNYISYSDFSSNWSTNLSGTITANQAEGLDKTQSMALLETSGISSGIFANSVNRHTASASGETYTLSVIVKHVAGGTQLRFRLEGTAFTGAIQGMAVDFSDGSFVSNSNVAPDAYEIKSLGNGFYKVSITVTTVASGNIIPVFYGNIAEDADFYIGMAQLEAGSFPTSYIKTTGSTATRSADVASIPTANFGYNQSEGTLLVDFDMKYDESGSAFPRVVEIASESSIGDRIKIQLSENTEVLAAQAYVNFNVQGTCGLGSRTGGSIDSTKVAFAFKENDFAASDNGDTAVTDTTGTFAPSVRRDTLAIGKQANSATNILNGHIKSIKYYPRRLTNAQLEDLSS